MEHGFVDAIVKRAKLRDKIAKLLEFHGGSNDKDYSIVREARDQTRLTALDYAKAIFDDFIQLHGDRSFRDDGAVIEASVASDGRPVTVIGIQKGKNLQDNLKRNFGQPHPEGIVKLAPNEAGRKFGRPIVTFINTAGAYPGVGAEERGQG